MIVIYSYCKLFHLLALFIWLGSLPVQAVLLRIIAVESDIVSRSKAAILLGKVSKYQVRPTLLVAVLAGVGMLYTSITDLSSLPWMQLKLGIAAVLIAFELFLVQPGIARLSRLYAESGPTADIRASTRSLVSRMRLVVAGYAFGYPTVLFLIFSRGSYHAYLALGALAGVAFIVLVRTLLYRASTDIAAELPHA
jgi:uncharacterized membrane protein